MASADSAIASNSKTKLSHFHCCVPNGTSYGRYEETLCFHRIPRDEALKNNEYIKIRRDEGLQIKVVRIYLLFINKIIKKCRLLTFR